jgi:hypothetical protein
VQLVRADVRRRAVRRQVDLADQRARRPVPVGDAPPAPVHLVHLGLVAGERVAAQTHRRDRRGVRVVGQARRLEQAVRDVDPQAVHAPVEPEPDHVVEEPGGLRVAPVPVRLLRGVQVQVCLLVDAGPGRAAEDAGPVVRRPGEVEPGPGRAARPGRERRPEQRVLGRAVVRDDVDDDPQAELVGAGQQRVEAGQRAEPRIHVAVVADVVAVVRLRRGIERGQPDRVHAEGGHVVQPPGDPGQVAVERARIDLVHHLTHPAILPERTAAAGSGVAG